jgi:hypothetical protein
MLPYLFLTAFFTSFSWASFTPDVIYTIYGFSRMLSYFYETLAKALKSQVMFVFLSVALLVPFVFIVESVLAYLVLPLGYIAPFMSLLLLAGVEEIVKITPMYHKRVNPILYGVVGGLSFFLMEKIFNLYLVYKAYIFLGGPYAIFMSKFLPTLGIHILSTTLFATIAYYSRRRSWFVMGLMMSVMIHFTYNVLVLRGLI